MQAMKRIFTQDMPIERRILALRHITNTQLHKGAWVSSDTGRGCPLAEAAYAATGQAFNAKTVAGMVDPVHTFAGMLGVHPDLVRQGHREYDQSGEVEIAAFMDMLRTHLNVIDPPKPKGVQETEVAVI